MNGEDMYGDCEEHMNGQSGYVADEECEEIHEEYEEQMHGNHLHENIERVLVEGIVQDCP